MRERDSLKLKTLISEVKDEISHLRSILGENERIMGRIKSGEEFDSIIIRGQGSIIHDFYCGIERIFEKIAYDINGGLPDDPSWHQRLLHEMSLDIKDVRPAIVTKETYNILKEFLSFRHLFRNIYGFELDSDKIDSLSSLLSEKGPIVLEEIENKMRELEKDL